MKTHFYWSVRRELWENRSIYIAPLAVAALAVFGFLIGMASQGHRHALSALDPAKQANAVAMPYSMAASVILLAGWIVGVFYAVDALYGERRDRSVLFWKSMPVSDLTTVLAKVFIPLAVLPVISMAAALSAQLLILLASTAFRLANGLGPAMPSLGTMTGVMLYGMAVHALWFAPIYGWLLLVSAWARRAPFLWALLPAFAICVVEMLATGKSFFAYVLRYRVVGAMQEAFAHDALKGPITQLSQLEPLRFLSSPNLWLGLAFAAICVAGAIRVRRYREPI